MFRQRKKLYWWVVCMVSFLYAGGAVAANRVTLVSNGEAKATIVVAANCPKVVSVAAEELQRYIEKMSGAKLPIVKLEEDFEETLRSASRKGNLVLVGQSRYTRELRVSTKDFKPDGYQMATVPNVLFIIGKDTCTTDPRQGMHYTLGSVGTLHGVYHFLESLGVRWFYPTAIGEVVPKKKDVVVENLNVKDAPYFSYRNALYACPLLDRQWYWRIGFGIGEFVPDFQCHPFTSWRDKYKESHPEYFAIRGGKTNFRNICFCNPGARKRMLQQVKGFFTAYPYRHPYFTILFNDGCTTSCECERCKAKVVNSQGWSGSDSNIIAEAAIELARATEKDFPGRGILIGAYNKCIRPPTNVKKLPPNVAVIICKHGRLHQWSKDYIRNVNYVIEGWRKLQPKEIYFWEYYGHGRGFEFAPHYIAADIKHLKELSEKGPRICGERVFGDCYATLKARTWWFNLNCYVNAKCLWNPDLDVDELLEDYYDKFYGPAKAPMKKFFERAERLWVKGNHGMKWEYGDKNVEAQLHTRRQSWQTKNPKVTFLKDKKERSKALYPAGVLSELSGYLDEAKVLAKDSPYKERVTWIAEGFRLTKEDLAKEQS